VLAAVAVIMRFLTLLQALMGLVLYLVALRLPVVAVVVRVFIILRDQRVQTATD
jgi:hypothetical protein